MAQYYPKTEVDLKIDPIHAELKQHREAHEEIKRTIKEGFDGVYKRQDTTNGRVKSLELWKAGLAGATGVLAILVVPVIIYVIESAL